MATYYITYTRLTMADDAPPPYSQTAAASHPAPIPAKQLEYIRSRPCPAGLPSSNTSHTICLHASAVPDEFPYLESWSNRDISARDWDNFLNFLLNGTNDFDNTLQFWNKNFFQVRGMTIKVGESSSGSHMDRPEDLVPEHRGSRDIYPEEQNYARGNGYGNQNGYNSNGPAARGYGDYQDPYYNNNTVPYQGGQQYQNGPYQGDIYQGGPYQGGNYPGGPYPGGQYQGQGQYPGGPQNYGGGGRMTGGGRLGMMGGCRGGRRRGGRGGPIGAAIGGISNMMGGGGRDQYQNQYQYSQGGGYGGRGRGGLLGTVISSVVNKSSKGHH